MSLILNSIKATLSETAYQTPMTEVSTFAFVTTVKTRRVGLSMTMSDDRVFDFKVRTAVSHLGEIETLGLRKVLAWTDSLHGIERSFAIAALNSAIELKGQRFFTGNALELTARLAKGKKVAVVGHFPNMENIKAAARTFTILEKRPQEGDRNAEDAVEVIPQSDVVAVTGVTCLNDTIEGLLALKRKDAIFIVLGPTVPLSPVLFDFGVDVIGGAWVEDENEVLKKMSQGGTARHVNGLRSVLFPKNPSLLEGFDEVLPPAHIL